MSEDKQMDKEMGPLKRRLASAEKRLQMSSDARRSLPPGSSRARVTTANARLGSAAEEVQRIRDLIDQIECGER